ncbi:MAG: prepilin-type N-terminal cleavage/methylation domain-containing protein, partial [Mollicutes bacterium]|nr:prepilin-type N-terminal cleavage/methylation domain-containing protein [Mollicutes bacterium]
MMRKGFTLIETMAVLIIITVILLITVPIVNYIIKEVKKESFKVG